MELALHFYVGAAPGRLALTLALVLMVWAAPGHAQAQAPAPRTLVLTHANLVDGRSEVVRRDVTIVVRGTDIAEVLSSPSASPPDSAFVLDVAGGWVMPGLIDSHVHVSHEGRASTEKALRRALLGGVTTVRDMGGDARRLAGLARDAWLGEIDAPDIVYAAVFAGETFFTDPRVVDVTRGAVPGEAAWARAVSPSTDLVQAVLLAKGAGASAVKIYTDLPPAELVRVTTAAHAQGLRAWSHATVFPSRPSDAVAAGIDVLSHSSMLQWQLAKEVPPRFGPHRNVPPLAAAGARSPALAALFAEMKRRGTILDATLFVGAEMVATTTDSARKQYWVGTQAFAVAATRAAHAAGVKVSAGTDDLIGELAELPNLHEELRLLVECGFSPMQALTAVTRVSAEAAGVDDRVGTVEPGRRANLLVLAADPTENIANTKTIRFVVKAGRLFVRQ